MASSKDTGSDSRVPCGIGIVDDDNNNIINNNNNDGSSPTSHSPAKLKSRGGKQRQNGKALSSFWMSDTLPSSDNSTKVDPIPLAKPIDALTALEFLNCCFPDIDVDLIADVLHQHGDDVVLAVESLSGFGLASMRRVSGVSGCDNIDVDDIDADVDDDVDMRAVQAALEDVEQRMDAADASSCKNIPNERQQQPLFDTLVAPDDAIAQLCSMFPRLDVDVLAKELRNAHGDWNRAVDRCAELEASGSCSGKRMQRSQLKQHVSVRVRMSDEHRVSSNAFASETYASAPELRSLRGDSQPVAVPERDGKGSEYYRQLVSTYADERHKHFTRAAREFKRNDRYAGQVAMFYAMEGRAYHAKLLEANMHAAVETVHENRERQDYLRPRIGAGSTSSGHVLDLHHVHVKESLVLLELELKRWYAGATLNGGRPRSKMTVITGKGNNSTHGTSRLMPAVTAYLQQNGWTFEQGDGFVVVKNRSDRQE